MECVVKWTGPGGMSFVAETGSGHAVVMDGAPDVGGRNLGPRPMEMVLLGTGGWGWLYGNVFDRWITPLAGAEAASLAMAIAFVAVWWLPMWWLDRRRIYLKI